jgi:tRNA (cytidine32/uridine32-2'-O)-methyltransferase
MAYLATNTYPEQDNPYPKQAELEMFHTHLEETLWDTGFINKAHPGIVMNRLRRLFTRARPEAVELNILRGALVSIQRNLKK